MRSNTKAQTQKIGTISGNDRIAHSHFKPPSPCPKPSQRSASKRIFTALPSLPGVRTGAASSYFSYSLWEYSSQCIGSTWCLPNSVFTPSNPIFKAAYEGRLGVIRDYISEGGSINALDKWNNTALHWAAKGNQYRVMTFLVQNGVDVDAENSEGETALHWSTYSNNVAK